MSHIDDGKLNALLDGELESSEAAAVQSHIAGCADCAKRLEDAKRFLAGAEDLLGALELPQAAASKPQARRVSKTAKEVAIDLDGATRQSPALDVEVPAPLFHRGTHAPRARPERAGFDYTSLAWAAIIVLAVGVGYLANEVRHAGGEAAVGEGSTARRPAAPTATPVSQPAADKQEPVTRTAPSAPAPAGAERIALAGRPGGPPAAKAPPGQAKPVVPGRSSTGLGHKRLDTPTRTMADARTPPALAVRNADALATSRLESSAGRAAPAAPSAAAPPALGNAPAAAGDAQAPAIRNSAEPPLPAQPAAAAQGAGALQAEGGAAQRGAVAGGRAATRDTLGGASLEEAVTRLQGTIRLIDGMSSNRVEIVPGRSVSGADSTREVVRVFYGAAGHELVLEQQRLSAPARAPTEQRQGVPAADAMGFADTLLTVAPDGQQRLRWLDRAGFWLSLSGRVPVDSLRSLAERVK